MLCFVSGPALVSRSSVTLRLLHVHYNRGSQVMNICVWPAVKISLITPRLERGAAYLAGQQAAGLATQPPGDAAPQPCCVVLWQGLFVVFVSRLSLCLAVTTCFGVTQFPKE